MPTIQDQLELEQNMILAGRDHYFAAKKAQTEAGRGSENTASRKLIDGLLMPLADALRELQEKRGARKFGKAVHHLRKVDPYKGMLLALKCIFNVMDEGKTPVYLASSIGTMLEDEIRFSMFEETHREYYKEILDDFQKKGTKSYRHKHRVLTHSANKHNDGWTNWATAEKVEVGMRVLDLIMMNSDILTRVDLVRNGKKHVLIHASHNMEEWMLKHDEAAALLRPVTAPCIIQPADWVNVDEGGYYNAIIRRRTRMVMQKHPRGKVIVRSVDMPKVYEAVNKAQHTPWQVNKRVYEVARQVWAMNMAIGMPNSTPLEPDPSPVADVKKEDMDDHQKMLFEEWKRYASGVHTAERERRGKGFQVARIMSMARDYSQYDSFWYVWNLDFRGRMYTATTGFSPQGPDLGKGLIRFANGKRLGERGWYWLRVHGANRYGYDKEDYDKRVQWVDERREHFLRAAADPLGNTDVWATADKPYQFLAFLFEYADATNGSLVGRSPEEYVSYLPVGLDGSCNGLQHFSAMLRDEFGGRATNLISGDKPSDIYMEVSKVCTEKLKDSSCPIHARWYTLAQEYGKNNCLPRSIAKRPVMTMPYGSTRQSCTEYIFDAARDIDPKYFGDTSCFVAASKLTPLLWDSIGEVVTAAREAMNWLQKSSSVVASVGLGCIWQTSDGFPAYQFEREMSSFVVDTQLMGRFQVRVGEYQTTLDKRRQRNGIAPNFVHSQDASHLRATIRLAYERGITDLALIHDDYGTHAANTDALHEVIRLTFVEQYRDFNPLQQFKDLQEKASGLTLPDLPEMGTLDIEQVITSKFFFG